MIRFIIFFFISATAIADCNLMSRPHLDGGLMVFEEKEDSIRIYDGRYKEQLTKNDIWWQWNVGHVKDSFFRSMFSKTKNEVKQVLYQGSLHLLIVSSRGDGVALINFDTRKVVFQKRVLGSIHSAAMVPGDNILLADSKGFVKLLSTSTGKITSSCKHNAAHGVVWDKKQELAWVLGGSRLSGYSVRGSRLLCNDVRFVGLPGGGHDLQPMLDLSSMLLFSSSSNIFFFETDLEWHGGRWGMLQKFPGASGIKGVSRNIETGEIVYVRNDRSNGIKFRSNVIRSLDGRKREVLGKTGFYKARWVQKNCFSW